LSQDLGNKIKSRPLSAQGYVKRPVSRDGLLSMLSLDPSISTFHRTVSIKSRSKAQVMEERNFSLKGSEHVFSQKKIVSPPKRPQSAAMVYGLRQQRIPKLPLNLLELTKRIAQQ